MARAENLTRIVADAIVEAGKISDHVEIMVTGIQFQDRTRQRLEHVSDALRVIDQATSRLRDDTAALCGTPADAEAFDQAWVKDMLDGFKMSDLRSRFIDRLIADGAPATSQHLTDDIKQPSESGTVELF